MYSKAVRIFVVYESDIPRISEARALTNMISAQCSYHSTTATLFFFPALEPYLCVRYS